MGLDGSNDRWIVEHSGEPVGMIVRDEAGFIFHASAVDLWELDRQVFPTMHAAPRAARQAAIQANSRPSGDQSGTKQSFKRGHHTLTSSILFRPFHVLFP